ncbi:MAG: 16S rRNA (adenine(1518)-N(6)/adenine(1519)-N(6))-dimethyltransferase RsmA [Sandaracinaceae bacterium]|nr:16S rRNA (adenine(1518)-N(6)/adenine(1519)-N(6))-dimethyltransferase RsmA [Sandaracinaceae bacterium]
MEWEDPRRVLARHGLAPKKAFSQNFLVSRSAVEAIARAAVEGAGVVVELGPGLGTLTTAILRYGARVVAVERDRDMVEILRAELASEPGFEVREGDAASVDLTGIAREVGTKISLAGNLPYAITGAILRNLVAHRAVLSQAVVMVQREVRDRLVAAPGTREWGALSVFTQAAFDAKGILRVPAGAFHPPPKVDSAVVRLVPRATPRAEETAAFRDVVHAAFGTRRKTLRNALRSAGMAAERIDDALAEVGIDGTRRGETLSIEELAALAEALAEALGAG